MAGPVETDLGGIVITKPAEAPSPSARYPGWECVETTTVDALAAGKRTYMLTPHEDEIVMVPMQQPPPVPERMDKIPPRALLRVGRVLGEGMKYEIEEADVDDWSGRPPAYHLNRALRHIALHQTGDNGQDHVGHAMARLLMWGDMLE